MAATRARIDKQNIKSTTPRSLVYTDLANEQIYFAPPTGGDFVLKWDDTAGDLDWLSAASVGDSLGTGFTLGGGSGTFPDFIATVPSMTIEATLSSDPSILDLEYDYPFFGFQAKFENFNNQIGVIDYGEFPGMVFHSKRTYPDLSYNLSKIDVYNNSITMRSSSAGGDSGVFSISPSDVTIQSRNTINIAASAFGTGEVVISGKDLRIVDLSGTGLGSEFGLTYGSYYADIITNARSIPDVGIVEDIVDTAIGASGFLGQSFTSGGGAGVIPINTVATSTNAVGTAELFFTENLMSGEVDTGIRTNSTTSSSSLLFKTYDYTGSTEDEITITTTLGPAETYSYWYGDYYETYSSAAAGSGSLTIKPTEITIQTYDDATTASNLLRMEETVGMDFRHTVASVIESSITAGSSVVQLKKRNAANTSDTAFFITDSYTNFVDETANKLGIQYGSDYSATIKVNPRSIPDVGTVEELIADNLVNIYNNDGTVTGPRVVSTADSLTFEYDDGTTGTSIILDSSITLNATSSAGSSSITQTPSLAAFVVNNVSADVGSGVNIAPNLARLFAEHNTTGNNVMIDVTDQTGVVSSTYSSFQGLKYFADYSANFTALSLVTKDYVDTAVSGTVTGTGTATRVAFWNGTSTLSSDADLYWDDTNNRLGIGTAAPAALLEVRGGQIHQGNVAGSTLKVTDGNSIRTTSTFFFDTETTGDIYFRPGFNTALTILNNGNVGIGTTTPVTKLEIPGNTSNSSAKFGAYELQSYAVNNSWLGENTYFDGGSFRHRDNGYVTLLYFLNGALQVRTGPSSTAGAVASTSTRMVVLENGNVGINTVSPSALFEVNGAGDFYGNLRIRSGLQDGLGGLGTAGYILSSTGTATEWITPPSGTNIYNANGSLTGNRTLTGGTYSLTFNFDDGAGITSSYVGSSSFQGYSFIDTVADLTSDLQLTPSDTFINLTDNGTGNNLTLQGTADNYQITRVGGTGTQGISLSGSGLVITDSELLQGAKYAASYAAYFATNLRSIPDVGYVNTLIASTIPTGVVGQIPFYGTTTTLTSEVASGTNSLFWNATDNRLAIARTSADYTLDVGGTGNFRGPGNTTSTNYGFISIVDTTNTGVNVAFWTNSLNATGNNVVQILTGNTVPPTGGWGIYQADGNKNYFAGPTAIGVVSGSGNLHVRGAGTTSSTYTAQFHNSTGSNNALVIRDDGNVGIRTASPSSTLHINEAGSAAGALRVGTLTSTPIYQSHLLVADTSYPYVLISSGTVDFNFGVDTANNTADLLIRTNHPLVFFTNNTERMRLLAGGNFGIGTITPSAKLHLFSSDSTTPLKIQATTAYPYLFEYLKPDGSHLFRGSWDGGNFHHYYASPVYYNFAASTSAIYYGDTSTALRVAGGMRVMIDPSITGSQTGITFGAGGYATAGTPLTYNRALNFTTWAWNGSDGYSITTNSYLEQIQLSTTNGDAKFTLRNNASEEVFTIKLLSKTFGVNNSSPTAQVHVGAGTATAGTSPLKLTSGTNLTTPEAGAMEWDGTRLYQTQTSGPTRQTIAYLTDVTTATTITDEVYPIGTGTGIEASDLSRTSSALITSTEATRIYGVWLNGMAAMTSGFIAGSGYTGASTVYAFDGSRGGTGALAMRIDNAGTGATFAHIKGNTTGDAYTLYNTGGSNNYSVGIDASATHTFKIMYGSNPSTGTTLFTASSGGNVGIRTTPHATQQIHLSGTLRLDVGSDATGDVYYRNSGGAFTRLGIGSNGQVLTLASGLPSWASLPAPDGNGMYTGSGALSGATTVTMGTNALSFSGIGATNHLTSLTITPSTDNIYLLARDLSVGSYIAELFMDPTFVSIGLQHDTIPGGDSSFINFQPTGSAWTWGNHEILMDGGGIFITDGVSTGLVYAADYSSNILSNNTSIPDIFTVRENAIENYSVITSTTSPVNLNGVPPDYLINQGGTQATFTFSLPASPVNGEVCKLTFNNAVTTLTITAQGGVTILGTAPTTAAIGTQLEYKYYHTITSWIRVK